MGNVLKSNRYRIVDNKAFDLPLPLTFTILREDTPVCKYTVSADEQVSYDIITKYTELMITTIHRPLNISDIYYLFSCRVFQDKTPYTYPILDRMGMEKYSTYNIMTLTHGITPYDDYWVKFDGEELTYEEALSDFEEYVQGDDQPVPVFAGRAESAADSLDANNPKVSAILSQHKLDINSLNIDRNANTIVPEESYRPALELESNKMSQDDIESLLRSCGITDDEPAEKSDISLTDNAASAVDAVSRSEEVPETSGGKMSQEDIEKLLAASMPAEPEPAPVPENSGGKMSQEDIEKLLAASMPAEPEPAPVPETSGGKMSQEDIEKLLAASMPAEPEPAPVPETSGGKMSQADIEALLNSMQDDAKK